MLKTGYILGNRYQVIKTLGQGGQSNVYLLKDLRLKGKKWVAKEMVTQYAEPRDQALAKAHFEQEANLLATLEHPNLPRVIDYFTQGGKYYLIMSYLKGEDLERKLKRRKAPFTEEEVAGWAVQIATVLYYLHRQKKPVIFRDIKPSNIMICQGQVKLIDFGIARHFNPSKHGDTLRIGSPGYSPPEQYSGQTDPRSDIFALGVTMHHLLTGQDPSKTKSPFNLPPMAQFNPHVSTRMEEIIQKATRINPDERYQDALLMKSAIRDLIRSKGTRKVLDQENPTSDTEEKDNPPEEETGDQLADADASHETVEVPGENNPVAEAENGDNHGVQPSLPEKPDKDKDNDKKTGELNQDDHSTPTDIKELARQKAREILEKSNKTKESKATGKKSPAGVLVLLALIVLFAVGIRYILPRFFEESTGIPISPAEPSPAMTPSDIDLATDALSQNQPRKALRLLENVRKKTPRDPIAQLHINNAWAMMTSQHTVEAVIGINPDNPASGSILSGAVFSQHRANLQGGIRGRKLVLTLVELSGNPDRDRADLMSRIQEEPGPMAVIIARDDLPYADEVIKEAESREMPLLLTGSLEADSPLPGGRVNRQSYFRAGALLARREGFKKVRIKASAPEELSTALKNNGITIIRDDSTGEDSANSLGGLALTVQGFRIPWIIEESDTQSLLIISPLAPPEVPEGTDFSENRAVLGLSPLYQGPENPVSSNFIIEYSRLYGDRLPDYYSAAGADSLDCIIFAARQAFPQSRRIYRFLGDENIPVPFTGILTPEASLRWSVQKLDKGQWKQTGGFITR